MEHELNLNKLSFQKIVDGSKIIELRLFDEKRRKIQLGDTLTFHENDNSSNMISKKVIGLVHFPDFETLIEYLPLSFFGHNSKDEVKSGVNAIYSLERQRENSVLGIILAPL